MPYAAFHSSFPEVAQRETRTITLLDDSRFGLPLDQYTFLEMFCDEPGCDCRRVFFNVVSSYRNEAEAMIAYGWESRDFYVKWMGDDDPYVIDELRGPALNLASPQSSLAPAVLEMFRSVLLPDTAYIERVQRHYAMFREKVDRRRPAKLRRRANPRRKRKA